MPPTIDDPIPPELGLREWREYRASVQLPPAIEPVYDLIELMLTVFLDIVYLRKALDAAASDWERRLFGRFLALTLYEAFDDLSVVLPTAMRQIADTVASDEVKTRELSRSLARIKRAYTGELRSIRNAAAAHRAKDAAKLRQIIESLDLPRIENAAVDLCFWLGRAQVVAQITLAKYWGAQPAGIAKLEEFESRFIGDVGQWRKLAW